MARGSITARHKGRNDVWRIRIFLGHDANGKQKYHREEFHGPKKAAQARLTELLREIDTGGYVEPTTIKVGAFLDRWLRDYAKPNVRPRTYEWYEMIVEKHLKPALGHIQLAKLRPYELQAYYAEKSQTLAPATVRHHHRVIHKALECAVVWGLVARNVAKATQPPKKQRKEMQVWTAEETTAFLDSIRGHRLYALYVLALTAGLRRGELVGLRWQDVDIERGYVHVRQAMSETSNGRIVQKPKSEAGIRSVKIDPETVAVLRSHQTQAKRDRLRMGSKFEDHGLVFCQANGRPINAHNLSARAFPTLCEKAGVPRIRFHDMRHTHATRLLEAGVPYKAVQERLGHSSGVVTIDTYSHVLPPVEEKAAKAMAELMRKTQAL